MEAVDARAHAAHLLARRLRRGWSRAAIDATAYEGASGPRGYLLAGGRISVPGCLRHTDPGVHTFRVRDLLDAIERGPAQPDLFGEAA